MTATHLHATNTCDKHILQKRLFLPQSILIFDLFDKWQQKRAMNGTLKKSLKANFERIDLQHVRF